MSRSKIAIEKDSALIRSLGLSEPMKRALTTARPARGDGRSALSVLDKQMVVSGLNDRGLLRAKRANGTWGTPAQVKPDTAYALSELGLLVREALLATVKAAARKGR